MIKTSCLTDYVEMCMVKYGTLTIEDRAIPDYRDGLIPVYRRCLWAAYKQHNADKLVKTARLVGDVLGKYHPHGDTAVVNALRNLIQAANPLFVGGGNWGSFDDPKSIAAMRYTQVRLSSLSKACFFNPYQLKALELIPNFDGEEEEPIILHSNIPVLLLTGATGIAVGTTCGIPSYSLRSVAKLTATALSGKKITPKMCMSLEFCNDWGGHIHPKHIEDGSLLEYYKTGAATLYFRSDFHIEGKNLVVTGICPNLDPVKALTKTYDLDCVQKVLDESDTSGIRYVFTLKCKPADVEEYATDIIENIWTSFVVMRTNITERLITDEAKSGGSHNLNVSFSSSTIADIINKWAEYRLETERTMAGLEIQDLSLHNHRLQLSILAYQYFDIVRDCLLRDDSEKWLATNLSKASGSKVTVEDATYILEKQLKSLKRINLESSRVKIQQNEERIKVLKGVMKDPSATCIDALRLLTKQTE